LNAPGPPAPRPWRNWRVTGGTVALILAVGAATLVIRIALWSGIAYRGYGTATAIIEIPEGAGAARALDLLERHGIVQRFPLTLTYLKITGRARGIKAGEYYFNQPMTPGEVFEKLIAGDVYYHRVTVLEGSRADEVFRQFLAAGFGAEEEFLAAFGDTRPIADIDGEAVDLEGYLFPDTYSLHKGTSAAAIVAMMVARFREVFTPEMVEKGRGFNLSVREAVTLASLVERETSSAEEDPLVASVFLNRLRKRMRLQCDPTVIYALQMRNAWDGNIRKNDLRIDSRYNTYRYFGLPPGPIGSPGAAALRAAVEPATTTYLYFVSMNTGRHRFSSSLEEHNRAVWQYQKRPYMLRRRSRSPRGPRGN
jgi:UPF0755 protein